MTIVVFLPNWVGDAVMATPTLRALRARFPRPARMVGVGQGAALAVLEGTPWFDEAWVYERRPARPGCGFLSVCRRLRRARCDLAVLLPNAPRHAALAWLGGARRRIGYDRRGRGFLLTDRLAPPRADGRFTPVSTLEYYLALARAAGCEVESRSMELALTMEDEAAADAVWRHAGWTPEDTVVALNNSGAFGSAKLWPEEHVLALARRIAASPGLRVLLLCGPAERAAAERIAAASGAGVASLAPHAPRIGLTKACVRRCHVLVSTDSGPRHIGLALGVPVVSLFGPTDEAWSAIADARETRLAVPLECRPCQQPICPLGHHRCMRELPVERVWDAVRHALEGAP